MACLDPTCHCTVGCPRLPLTAQLPTCRCLYSGGWDYAVRIWARQGLACAGTLAFDDWVWCVAPRGDSLLVSAGVKVHVHDLGTGRQLRRYDNPHGVNVSLLQTGPRAPPGRWWAAVTLCPALQHWFESAHSVAAHGILQWCSAQ